ncbi:lipopolysaccharide biosynthesis protein [Janthinobacterium sp. SUN033]|uniref:lipopolysaccharide biosynthesis protein n=1 Tax=Janthinobacterium sp. SUN033 TaxID=3002439 RepID=UPI0025AF48BA|nr:lipopolysaccharide biosynthesis protein [Janthinobacterium sp. SUN033]MDN2677718.1 lipopolysaccharide biosynthesis protein [Janthinobacterium sp. SUN033]
MEKHDELNESEVYVEDDDFNLTNFLTILWQSRGVILAGTALVAILGTSSALFLGKYQSEGFLQFGGAIPEKKIEKDGKEVKEQAPGIALADYKRFSSPLNTSERFNEFIRQNNIENDPTVIALSQTFAARGGIAKVIEPIFPFTKLDAKELMSSTKDADNNVIAVSINYAAKTPESAQQAVSLLGRYTVDTIVYMIYTDILRFKNSEISAAITKLDNKIIENKEKIDSYQRKGVRLKQIVTRYPDAASQASRQLVSITEDTARYLSPLSQLMTSEVEITEANEAIYKAKREQKQYMILAEYYDRAKALAESTKSGEAILRGLEPIKKTVFSGKDMEDETIKEVYNKISVDNSSAISLYLEKTRFIAGPSLPKNRTTRTSVALLGSLLAGLSISILFVLGRRWWQNNRQQLQG